MDYMKAALLSYDVVIEKYHDTEYAPLAYLEKAEILLSRERYAEAEDVVTRFLDRFPNSVLRARAEELKKKIDAGLETSPKGGTPASHDTLNAGSLSGGR
jgi:hypothetical protein